MGDAMALKPYKRSKRNEVNIDPFNAPDPVMPSGEPDLMGVYDPVVSSEEDFVRAFQSSKTSKPARDRKVGSQTDTHTWHEETYTAPSYSAPEVQEAPTSVPSSAPASSFNPPKRSHRKKRVREVEPKPRAQKSLLQRVFTAIVFIIVIGQFFTLIPSCIDSFSSNFSGNDDYEYYSDYSYSNPLDDMDYSYSLEAGITTIDPSAPWYENSDAFDDLASDVFSAEMDSIIAGESPYPEQAAAVFEYEFSSSCGFDLSEVGLDSQTIGTDMTSQITYEVSSANADNLDSYNYQAGFTTTGTLFFYVDCPDVASIAWDLASYVNYDLDLEPGDTVSEEDMELIAAEYNRLLTETSLRNRFLMVDFSATVAPGGSDVTISLDESSWDYAVREIVDA